MKITPNAYEKILFLAANRNDFACRRSTMTTTLGTDGKMAQVKQKEKTINLCDLETTKDVKGGGGTSPTGTSPTGTSPTGNKKAK